MGYRAGTVALIGKPNVGKSTLMNAIVGQKVSIVSNKPQTTRRSALGIATTDTYQIAFVDTPGLHEPHTALGRAMVDQARAALTEVDLVLVVVDGSHHPGEADQAIAGLLAKIAPDKPLLLCMNKMDLLKAENVVRNVEAYSALFKTEDPMMTTATSGVNVPKLVALIVERLPEQPALYPADEFTDQSSRFMAAEFVREKILRATRQEVPHAVAVMVDDWDDGEDRTVIHATILVEKDSQRAILIGKQGQFVKKIGTEARAEIAELLSRPVHLELHVKVAENWRMNRRILHELEYE
jgi:GTP-binding protein Era